MYLVVIFCDEDDVATYTIKSVYDPRALNILSGKYPD
jgi:hypothetical protein